MQDFISLPRGVLEHVVRSRFLFSFVTSECEYSFLFAKCFFCRHENVVYCTVCVHLGLVPCYIRNHASWLGFEATPLILETRWLAPRGGFL